MRLTGEVQPTGWPFSDDAASKLRSSWKLAAIEFFGHVYKDALGFKWNADDFEAELVSASQEATVLPGFLAKLLSLVGGHTTPDLFMIELRKAYNRHYDLDNPFYTRVPVDRKNLTEEELEEYGGEVPDFDLKEVPWDGVDLLTRLNAVYDIMSWAMENADRFRRALKYEDKPAALRPKKIAADKEGNEYFLLSDRRLWLLRPEPKHNEPKKTTTNGKANTPTPKKAKAPPPVSKASAAALKAAATRKAKREAQLKAEEKRKAMEEQARIKKEADKPESARSSDSMSDDLTDPDEIDAKHGFDDDSDDDSFTDSPIAPSRGFRRSSRAAAAQLAKNANKPLRRSTRGQSAVAASVADKNETSKNPAKPEKKPAAKSKPKTAAKPAKRKYELIDDPYLLPDDIPDPDDDEESFVPEDEDEDDQVEEDLTEEQIDEARAQEQRLIMTSKVKEQDLFKNVKKFYDPDLPAPWEDQLRKEYASLEKKHGIWFLVAGTWRDWENLLQTFGSSRHPGEQSLVAFVEKVLPAYQSFYRARERERQVAFAMQNRKRSTRIAVRESLEEQQRKEAEARAAEIARLSELRKATARQLTLQKIRAQAKSDAEYQELLRLDKINRSSVATREARLAARTARVAAADAASDRESMPASPNISANNELLPSSDDKSAPEAAPEAAPETEAHHTTEPKQAEPLSENTADAHMPVVENSSVPDEPAPMTVDTEQSIGPESPKGEAAPSLPIELQNSPSSTTPGNTI